MAGWEYMGAAIVWHKEIGLGSTRRDADNTIHPAKLPHSKVPALCGLVCPHSTPQSGTCRGRCPIGRVKVWVVPCRAIIFRLARSPSRRVKNVLLSHCQKSLFVGAIN